MFPGALLTKKLQWDQLEVAPGITAMKIARTRLVLSLLAALTFLVACGDTRPDSEQLSAYTSVPPAAYIAEQVGAGHWTVGALAQQGKDPHTFSARPSLAAELGKSRIYFALGMEMDTIAMDKLGHAQLRTIEIADGHHHEAEAGHSHDPHIWLCPEGLLEIASAARDAFSQEDPANASDYKEAYERVAARIAAADEQAMEILRPYAGKRFYVQHDAFVHYAEHFGLRQAAIEQHDKDTSAARLSEILQMARQDSVRVLYSQPGHNPANLEAMAKAIGARVEPLDPMSANPIDAIVSYASTLASGFAKE
jgi:zinc transport system substrate-binding protein